MFIEILVLLFFLAASLYLAYQFRLCGHQMEIMQGSNLALTMDLDATRDCLKDTRGENLKLMNELEKTRSDLALTRGELEKTRAALNSCTDAINGGS